MSISKKRITEIAAIPDNDIDLSDIPEQGEEFFMRAKKKRLRPRPSGMAESRSKFHVPAVSVNYASTGSSTRSNELGMRPMQERAYEKRGSNTFLLSRRPPRVKAVR